MVAMICFKGSANKMNVPVANCGQQKGVFNRIFRQISHLPALPSSPLGLSEVSVHKAAADEILLEDTAQLMLKTKDPALTLRVLGLGLPLPHAIKQVLYTLPISFTNIFLYKYFTKKAFPPNI